MGILNVTPDSFSEQGVYFDRRSAIARGLEIEREGADLLDIGGESTRPGAKPVEEEEEMDRTIPVIEALRRKGLRIPISIDTYKAAVAERALRAGAEIVNDISGLRYDNRLASVVQAHRAALVLMHVRGKPQTMQHLPKVKEIVPSIRQGFSASIRRAFQAGIGKQRIVLDPGIGFGKSYDQNFEILNGLARFGSLGYPILVGPSRKSFITRTVSSISAATVVERSRSHLSPDIPVHTPHPPKQTNPKNISPTTKSGNSVSQELLFGTAAAIAAAVLNGAHIVRVHDVRQMVAVARMADRIMSRPPTL